MSNPAEDKILIVTSNFPPIRGGSASVYANLAAQLKSRTIVLAPKLDYRDELPHVGWREYDLLSGGHIVRLPLIRSPLVLVPTPISKVRVSCMDFWIKARVACMILYLWACCRVRTVCVGELLSGCWIFHLCKIIPGMRSIAYVHGEEITTDSASGRNRWMAKSALKASNIIVVVSEFTQEKVCLLDVCFTDKTHLITNGVDTQRFSPGLKDDRLLLEYDLEGRFVFVSVCRLVEKKGLDHLIRAFAGVRSQFDNIRLLIVGVGPFRGELDRIVQVLELRNFVVFAGDVPEDRLVDHYRLGDVFIMPNRSLPNGDTEGFGLVFLEANSCGLPVIAGRDGGSVEAVKDGVNGLIVDGRHIEDIADAMLWLVRDKGAREKLTLGGIEAALKADWSSRAKLFLKLIDS